MSIAASDALSSALSQGEDDILANWLTDQKAGGLTRDGRIKEAELQTQSRELLKGLVAALKTAGAEPDAQGPAFLSLRGQLEDLSRSRAEQGFSPKETALLVFSLKQSVFAALQKNVSDPKALAEATWSVSRLLDDLGLLTVEYYQRAREAVIQRQNQEINELSTPVVTLWDGIVALPLIGTLDSSRTQTVMENLLNAIVDQGASIAIIDITGVPTVDTLVAQHLIKTVSAARLMGADCLISGIRPQIAQTMVHLGVDLNVTTKATLAGAFKVALDRTGQTVAKKRLVASASAAEGL